MPSERRLHPISILLGLAGQVREFAVPWLVGGATGFSVGMNWGSLMVFLFVPFMLVAVVRYISFRYLLDENEMVIRTGLFFRNERRIPLGRIQNLEARQNLFHRLFGVVELKVETGGGQDVEATMSALPMTEFEEMRRQVFQDRGEAATALEGVAAGPAGETALLRLTPTDLMICGLVQNTGFVVIAAGFGLLWELGLLDGWMEGYFGDQEWSEGLFRDLLGAMLGGAGVSLSRVAIALGFLAALFGFIRLLSMGWTLLRLHGFTLERVGEDLRIEYGLVTRVANTIPLRRIQKLTIREGPLHRLLGRVSVRVETARGQAEEQLANADRWLAPILRRDDLPRLIKEVLSEPDLETASWNGAHPRAFRRAVKQWAFVALLISLPFLLLLRLWYPLLLALLLGWAVWGARREVQHLGWALTDRSLLFRSGWIWRQLSAVRFTRIQVVAHRQSPFDRRALMGRVKVDTAGGGQFSHSLEIPYLARETARDLSSFLALEAARTEFSW